MSDSGMPGTKRQQEGGGQYDPASLALLEGMEASRRPWQVLLTWMRAKPPSAGLSDAVGEILALFPDTGWLTVHTATPDDPFWSPLGKAGAGIMAAAAAGQITPGQAIEQIKQLYGPDVDDDDAEAGDPIKGPEA